MKALMLSGCLVVVFIALSCHDLGEGPGPGGPFALYLLADSTLDVFDVKPLPLSRLALQERPLITVDDLTSYSWSSHAFRATPKVDNIMQQMVNPLSRRRGIPFVVAAGTDRIYLGSFWPGTSSLMDPGCPFIEISVIQPYRIQRSIVPPTDLRSDPRLRESFARAGILKNEEL